MSWTDERVELLRKLWLEGLSASQIANELANGITRNAVIGKVHRLGLSGRAKAPSATPALPRPRVKAPTPPITARTTSLPMRGNTALAVSLQPLYVAEPRPTEDVVIPMSERVTIMDLREAMCRWPIGDPTTPEFRFCGGRFQPGDGPYCTYHARIAYQPVDRRRDRRMQRSA
jgi:GcrA cell cycle regulator